MQATTPLAEILTTTARHLASLQEINLITLKDLLNYFPRRYVDFSRLKKIAELGNEPLQTVAGKVQNLRTLGTRTGRTLITAQITDETGLLKLVWFNALWVLRKLKNGDRIALTGRLQLGPRGGKTLVSGTFEKLSDNMLHAGRIVPIYRHRGKLITSKWLREKIFPLLVQTHKLIDPLPPAILTREKLTSLAHALRQIHFPDSFESLEAARQSLAFRELFFLQLAGLRRKADWVRYAGRGPTLNLAPTEQQKFLANLHFKLTAAQKRVLAEILRDLAQTRPMNRLLEGDVGSGKTVVAALTILAAVKSGYQAALLAPTEILAAQHFRNFLKILHPLNVKMDLLTGSRTAGEKRGVRSRLKAGQIDLVVGTHALLEKKVQFRKLALTVIDEQHRFGVNQRILLQKDFTPHVLALTATPIPRTLALTIFGDQDVSLIDEMPPGRRPPLTRIVPPAKRLDSYRWIESEVLKGHQVFLVCPLVEESERLDVASAKKEFERLNNEVFPHLTLGLLHGKLSSRQKDTVMADFATGKIAVLVATTVVEVGIDVPNATIMLIEAADRFGLAQLHQLRGRVGRGGGASYCFLFSESESAEARARLHAITQIDNGFELAEFDLKLRGPGEVFGIRQSGVPDLKVARFTDVFLIKNSRAAAERLLAQDPELKDFPLLKEWVAEIG